MRTRRIALLVVVLGLVGAWVWLYAGRDGVDRQELGELADRAAEESTPPSLVGTPLVQAQPEPAAEAPSPEAASPTPEATSYTLVGVLKDLATKEPIEDVDVGGTWSYYRVQQDKGSSRLESKQLEAEMLGEGRFRLVVEGSPPPRLRAITLADSAWSVLRVDSAEAGNEAAVGLPQPKPGATADITVWARRSYHLRGRVQDEAGRDLPGVSISYSVPMFMSARQLVLGGSGQRSNERGEFALGPFAEEPKLGFSEAQWDSARRMLPVVFKLEGFATQRVDPLDVPIHERDHWVVTLTRGATLAGRALDPWGHPVAGVPVVVEYEDAWDLRRGVRTDEQGRFRLEQLSPGPATLSLRAFARDLKAKREITIREDDEAIELVAEQVTLSRPPQTTKVLGLAVADVDDEIRKAYEVPEHIHVIILDPGENPSALGIGALERGNGIFHIGDKPVPSVRAMIEGLLEPTAAGTGSRMRIVYTFWNERLSGTNTQHISISAEQRAELARVLSALPAPTPDPEAASK